MSSSSDCELPSLDDLLAKPRAALKPTSGNQSPRKSPRKQSAQQKTATTRTASLISSRNVSFERPDLSAPLKPSASQRCSSQETTSSSPNKKSSLNNGIRQKQESTGRRQRSLKSPAKGVQLLFNSLADSPVKDGRERRGTDRANKQARKMPSFDSVNESEETGEVDIFKGTRILRKTPRRVVKKEVEYDGVGHEQLKDPAEASEDNPHAGGSHKDVRGVESDESFLASNDEADDDVDDLFHSLKTLTINEKKPSPLPQQKDMKLERKPADLSEAISLTTIKPPLINDSPHCTFNSSPPANSPGAILRFSPPPSPSHTKPILRPSTPESTPPPPTSPGKLLSPKKLKSPSKPMQVSFQAASRPSLDAFWSQDEVNTFHDQVSPPKILASPRKKHLLDFFADRSDHDESTPNSSILDSPKRKSNNRSPAKATKITAADKAEKDRLKAFNARKEALATDFLHQLDTRITDGQIARATANTGGVQIVWSKKLNSTAGRANWRRERRIPSATGASSDTVAKVETSYRHIATIELASKVVTTEDRLYNVLAHEFCHLANFMISRELKQPHGASFQSWARKVTKEFGKSHDIEVTTKHEYEIQYKYIWRCTEEACGVDYKRHSKSIDPNRHTCGRCRGKLVQILPRPRKGDAEEVKASKAGGGQKAKSEVSGYSRFVKEQWASVKEELPPKSPAKDVMREVAVRYRERKKLLEKVEVVEVAADAGDSQGSRESSEDADVEQVAKKLDFLKV